MRGSLRAPRPFPQGACTTATLCQLKTHAEFQFQFDNVPSPGSEYKPVSVDMNDTGRMSKYDALADMTNSFKHPVPDTEYFAHPNDYSWTFGSILDTIWRRLMGWAGALPAATGGKRILCSCHSLPLVFFFPDNVRLR